LTLVGLAAATAVLLAISPASHAGEADGARLYFEHCAVCHGEAGRGNGPHAPLFDPRPPDLRSGVLAQLPPATVVERVREGRPLDLRADIDGLRTRAREVETVAVYLARLPAVDWPAATSGRALYEVRCAECHGRFGRPPERLPPGVRTPPDLSDPRLQQSLSDAEMLLAVRHGRDGMPALTPRISEEEATSLAAFAGLLSPGHTTYAQYCAGCHGEDGRGARPPVEALRLPTVPFDESYFRQRDPEQVRAAIWHMVAEAKPGMPHYRERLSAAQAAAIVEYLRAADR
jgi:mono/diheme cytochrome c family protein